MFSLKPQQLASTAKRLSSSWGSTQMTRSVLQPLARKSYTQSFYLLYKQSSQKYRLHLFSLYCLSPESRHEPRIDNLVDYLSYLFLRKPFPNRGQTILLFVSWDDFRVTHHPSCLIDERIWIRSVKSTPTTVFAQASQARISSTTQHSSPCKAYSALNLQS